MNELSRFLAHFSTRNRNNLEEQYDAFGVEEMDSITQRALGCLALGAVGDTLGFGSGHNPKVDYIKSWELWGDTQYLLDTIEKVFHGNYRNIRFRTQDGTQKWVVSDDTLLHTTEARALAEIEKNTKETDIVTAVAKGMVETMEYQVMEKNNERCFGTSTCNNFFRIQKDPENWYKHLRYNPNSTGCGGAMRGMVFGFLYPKAEDRIKLIKTALMAGLLSNTSMVGSLGTLATATLTAFALDDIPVEEWTSGLLEVFSQAKEMLPSLKSSGPDDENFRKLIDELIDEKKWGTVFKNWNHYYKKMANSEERIPTSEMLPSNSQERDLFYQEMEQFINGYRSDPERLSIGDRGDTSVMLALHGFLSCIRKLLQHFPKESLHLKTKPSQLRELFGRLSKSQQEKIVDHLVLFTVLHGGDNDSTGSIALSLFGSVFGIEGVNKRHVFETEIIPEVIDLAKKIGELAKRSILTE